MATPTERGTFKGSAARLFNTLPDRLRQEPDYNKFVRLAKKLMFSEGESIWLYFELFKTLILNFVYIHSKRRKLGMFILFQER